MTTERPAVQRELPLSHDVWQFPQLRHAANSSLLERVAAVSGARFDSSPLPQLNTAMSSAPGTASSDR